MKAIHHVTPLIRSTPLSDLHGADVWLKMETAQPSGSFKLRGMGRASQVAVQQGARRLVSSSGGNAGYSVACAGRQLGVPVTVVLPGRANPRIRSLIESEGADIVVAGDVWDDAHAHALTLAEASDVAMIHPFDTPDAWAGHATMIEEVADHIDAPEAVVVAVGGGGLLCGVLEGLHRVGWTTTRALAVETHGAASYAAALAHGAPVTLPSIDTVALTLGAKRCCDEAVAWARRHPVEAWQCDDAAAIAGCTRFLDDHRVLVEPSCGAGLAAVYDGAEALRGRSTLVIVCGGASVTLAELLQWQAKA